QRSDAAHPIYSIVPVSFGLSVRFRTALVPTPMGRGGQPEEVARAILWLASTEASFTSGTFLDVTGGK
ncbi:SDR family oxidoreductase, partial [Neorhizobium sp. JUb45]|uniref:SDR family oxidoreductase n=1 Tax=Neorhizobium sp. JUb45 TaxID=2485113 RepID=UPI0010D65101